MPRKAKYDWGRSTNKRYQKFETRISTKLTATASSEPYADSGYIDIAQCLSVINRKLVRQGQVFKVKGMHLYSKDESPVTTYKVGVLPRTWVMFNAYKKARSLWLEQAQIAYNEVGASNMPKYLDFKVLADIGHYNAVGSNDIMMPMDFDENLVSATDGEWVYSKLHDSESSSDEYKLHMLGGHLKEDGSTDTSLTSFADLNSAGIVFAYQQSRGNPFQDQDETGSEQRTLENLRASPFGRLSLMDNDQMQDVIDDHDQDNDSPPYHYQNYPGAAATLKELTTIATGRVPQKAQAMQARIPAFEAPLGLIRVEVDAGSAISSEEVEVHLDTEIIGTI